MLAQKVQSLGWNPAPEWTTANRRPQVTGQRRLVERRPLVAWEAAQAGRRCLVGRQPCVERRLAKPLRQDPRTARVEQLLVEQQPLVEQRPLVEQDWLQQPLVEQRRLVEQDPPLAWLQSWSTVVPARMTMVPLGSSPTAKEPSDQAPESARTTTLSDQAPGLARTSSAPATTGPSDRPTTSLDPPNPPSPTTAEPLPRQRAQLPTGLFFARPRGRAGRTRPLALAAPLRTEPTPLWAESTRLRTEPTPLWAEPTPLRTEPQRQEQPSVEQLHQVPEPPARQTSGSTRTRLRKVAAPLGSD